MGGQQQEEPAALIPTVGDGRCRKTARDEQLEKEWQKIKADQIDISISKVSKRE